MWATSASSACSGQSVEPKSLRVSTHISIPYFRVSSFPNEVTGFSVTAHQGWALQSFMRFMTLWNSVLALHIVLSVSFQRYLALSWAFNYLLLQFTLSLWRIPSNSTILMYNLLPIISKCLNHCTGERIFLSSGCSQSSVAIFLVAEQWSCAKDYSGPTYHLDGDSLASHCEWSSLKILPYCQFSGMNCVISSFLGSKSKGS